MAYRPDLPSGHAMPAGHRIDIEHPLYKAFHADAEAKGWSQEAFSEALGVYVRASTPRSAPAPAPTPAAAPKPDFAKMTTAQKIAYSLSNPKRG